MIKLIVLHILFGLVCITTICALALFTKFNTNKNNMDKKIIKGDELQLFISGQTGCPAWATNHTLTLSGSTQDISTKDHGVWNATSTTKISWELTGEYLANTVDYNYFYDAMIHRQKLDVRFALVKNYNENGLTSVGGPVPYWIADVKGWEGKCVVTNLQMNAPTGENATISITLTGVGPLKEYDNTITDYSIRVTYNDVGEGMTLFNMRAYPYINSGWVSDGNTTMQIDISDGKLHDSTPSRDSFFIFYLSGPGIPEYMFSGVNTVDTVETTNNIYNVGQYAFDNSSLTEITIQTPTPINYGNYCFSNCMLLEHVNYSSGNGRNWLSAKHVNNSAFLNCVRLEDSVLGDACEYVLFSAFDGCLAMRNVWFGSSLERVNERAFLVDSQASTKTFHFYTEKAPYCGELAFGNIGYQTFILHNAASATDFVSGTDMATEYPVDQCDYQIAT